MIPIDRNQIVLVWKNSINNEYYCSFCQVRDNIRTKAVIKATGNCPIELHKCRCNNVDARKIEEFNNNEDIILATIFKCTMKGTICRRVCSSCTINRIITELQEKNNYESQ